MVSFIDNQIIVLESLEDSTKKFNSNSVVNNPKQSSSSSVSTLNNAHESAQSKGTKCLICNGDHIFSFCDIYKNKS